MNQKITDVLILDEPSKGGGEGVGWREGAIVIATIGMAKTWPVAAMGGDKNGVISAAFNVPLQLYVSCKFKPVPDHIWSAIGISL